MALSRDEAEEALRDISQTQQRSSKAFGYGIGAPHLFLWGIIWMIGYGISYARPQWSAVWPVLSLGGIAISFFISWRTRIGGARALDWRYGATAFAVFGFLSATFAILPPRTSGQIAAFFPVLVALFYALIGIWTRGARILILGIAIGVLTLFGYFYLPAYFLLWMAIVGGGGLILGGFWLRSL